MASLTSRDVAHLFTSLIVAIRLNYGDRFIGIGTGSAPAMVISDAHFESILSKIQGGDVAAAEEFVLAYEPLVRRAVRLGLRRSRLRRVFDSMDFCQSVFGSFLKQVMNGTSAVEGPEHLAGLLVVIARRKLATAMRKEYRERQYFDKLVKLSSADCIIDPSPTPCQTAMSRDLTERIQQELTVEERQIADLRAADLSWDEISGRIGSSPQACRVRLFRAIKRVVDNLGTDDHDA